MGCSCVRGTRVDTADFEHHAHPAVDLVTRLIPTHRLSIGEARDLANLLGSHAMFGEFSARGVRPVHGELPGGELIVDWPVALAMAVGATIGGYAGSRMAQRVPQKRVRQAIIAIGLTSGIWLLVNRF